MTSSVLWPPVNSHMCMLACDRVYVHVFVCYAAHKKLLRFPFTLIHLIFARDDLKSLAEAAGSICEAHSRPVGKHAHDAHAHQ